MSFSEFLSSFQRSVIYATQKPHIRYTHGMKMITFSVSFLIVGLGIFFFDERARDAVLAAARGIDWSMIVFASAISAMAALSYGWIPEPRPPKSPPLTSRSYRFEEFPIWYQALTYYAVIAPIWVLTDEFKVSISRGVSMTAILVIFWVVAARSQKPAPKA